MQDEKDASPSFAGFELGAPAFVCRWRLSGRALPLENRHLRALAARRVNDAPVSTQLVAWAKQHIEWTLSDGAAKEPDGVLMVVVDGGGRAAMTVGPYESLAATGVRDLAARALDSEREAASTGVAPETLWVVRDGGLVCDEASAVRPSGVASLVRDLAKTLGVGVACERGVALSLAEGAGSCEEAFLVSDEHGIVPASAASGPISLRLASCYARLLESQR